MQKVNIITNNLLLERLKNLPNQPAIWSIMRGPNPGKIQELSNGKAVVLIENGSDPFVYVVGELNNETFNEVLTLCPNDSFLYCDPIYHHLFVAKDWEIYLRAQLSYTNSIIKPIKDSWEIRPINNMKLFQRCDRFQAMYERFGSAENFFKYGKGYALCDDKQIIAEIYAAYYSKDEVDISIFTHPDYRGQGAASQLASYFAEQMVRESIIPIWECFPTHNEASLKTALSIGFNIERYYALLIQK